MSPDKELFDKNFYREIVENQVRTDEKLDLVLVKMTELSAGLVPLKAHEARIRKLESQVRTVKKLSKYAGSGIVSVVTACITYRKSIAEALKHFF